jgi:hypothetical protein
MRTFREFLEARQMMLFSTSPRDLYHGTVTGADDENLKSFRDSGAVSGKSSGYGQGSGFFVYTDAASARKQAAGIATGRGSSYRGGMDNKGRPMVVTVEAVLDPEDWDVDYELNHKAVMEFLLRNFDAVRDKLQSDEISVDKMTMGLRTWERPDHYKFDPSRSEKPHPLSVPSKEEELELEPMEGWMPREVEAGLKERPTGFRIRATGPRPIAGTRAARSRDVWHYGNAQGKGGMMQDGESIRIIMDLLGRNDPRVVRSFEELFFANMGPGIAVKYVGSSPLKPKRIEVAVTEGNMMPNQAADDHYWRAV